MQESLLKNNHSMMNTVVETFIIEETEPLIYDNAELEKWHSLVEKLNLTGQKKVAKLGLSPIPFLHMNQNMMRVCQTLCPSKVAIEDYDLTPIPTAVLDLVALSMKEHYFQQIEIWYDEQSPDPFCVGVTGKWVGSYIQEDFPPYEETDEPEHYFDSKEELLAYQQSIDATSYWNHFHPEKYYMIAKWGDVKQSFEELTERAKARHKEAMVARIQKDIAYAQQRLAEVDSDCDDYFINGDMDLPF
jgi:hypothetical protein